MFDAHYFRQEQRGCLGGYASLRNFKRVKTTVLPILLSTRILNIRVSACHSSLLRPAIVEGERKMPQYTYCHLNDRRQSLRPVSHWWRKVHATFFSPANLYTGRGYAKASIILKDERHVIFRDGSSVPIILQAFEGWTGQVMKGTRGSEDSENAAGTDGTFCLHHSTRIVSFLSRGWRDWKDHTSVSSDVGFFALLELTITDLGQLIKFHKPNFRQVWQFLKIMCLPSKPSWFPFLSCLREKTLYN